MAQSNSQSKNTLCPKDNILLAFDPIKKRWYCHICGWKKGEQVGR